MKLMEWRTKLLRSAASSTTLSFFCRPALRRQKERNELMDWLPCSSFIDQKIFESMAERAAGRQNKQSLLLLAHSFKRMRRREIGFVFMSCSLPPAALIKVRNEGRKTRIVLMSEWPAAGGQRESSKLHFIQFISLWEWEMKEWNWIVCLRGLACFFLFINCVDWKEKWRGWVGLLSWIVGYGRSSANAPQWKENEDKQLNQ